MTSPTTFRPGDYFPYGRHKITDPKGIYFVTLTVRGWIDLFTRGACRRIVLDSLMYCQSHKGLILYGYVIMSNHLHLLARGNLPSKGPDTIIRDFKRHTASRVKEWLERTDEEHRKVWMLPLLYRMTGPDETVGAFGIWQPGVNPVLCHSPKFLHQKLNYIHQNPVRAGIVDKPEDFVCSSARNYLGRKDCQIPVTLLEI